MSKLFFLFIITGAYDVKILGMNVAVLWLEKVKVLSSSSCTCIGTQSDIIIIDIVNILNSMDMARYFGSIMYSHVQ